MPAAPSGESKVLFGSKSHPWSPEDWTATDDRVRGGSSVSHLTCSPSRDSATFHGTLDIRTLGGAGFASQRTVDALRWDLSGYDSLVLCLSVPPGHEEGQQEAEEEESSAAAAAAAAPGAAGKRYTVVLKDADALPKRPDGREQSTVSWEFDFEVDGQGRAADGEDVVVMPFAEFKATYRGKPKEDAEPLDLSRITRVSFMMRSFFGEQEGDFSLALKSLAAVKNESRQPTQAESVCTNDKHSLDKPLPEQKGTEKQEQERERERRSWLSWLGSCFR